MTRKLFLSIAFVACLLASSAQTFAQNAQPTLLKRTVNVSVKRYLRWWKNPSAAEPVYNKNAFWNANKISQDAANFKAFPSDVGTGYAKDGESVYWSGRKLNNADPASFVGLNANYGKDKNTVWYGIGFNEQPRIVEKADAATFELDESGNYQAVDENYGFIEGIIRGRRD